MPVRARQRLVFLSVILMGEGGVFLYPVSSIWYNPYKHFYLLITEFLIRRFYCAEWLASQTPEFMESVAFTDESTFEIGMYTTKKQKRKSCFDSFYSIRFYLLDSIPDNRVNRQNDRRYGIPVHKGGDGPDPCHLATKKKYPVKVRIQCTFSLSKFKSEEPQKCLLGKKE